MRKNLTAKTIEGLKPAPLGGRYDVSDALVPGLGVRVTDKGKKTFILTARFPGSQNPTRRAIAEVGAIELAAAREAARGWLQLIAAGVDPQVEKERKRREAERLPETFENVAQRFLEQHVKKQGLRSAPETERILSKYLYPKWRQREFVTIRRGDVARLLDDIEVSAPVMADRVLAVLSKLCAWYQAREESYTSPIVRGMRRTKPAERARDRILADDELKALWNASASAGTFGAFVRVSLLTGQRRSKVASMRWDDVGDDGTWIIPAEAREKANAERLALPQLARDVIAAQPQRKGNAYVFAGRLEGSLNGFSKCKAAIDSAIEKERGAPLASWTLHDLRRTAKSLMVRAGVRPDISERVLGHAIAGVEGVYDRHSYDREKADALASLAGLIGRILTPSADSNVVLLKEARA